MEPAPARRTPRSFSRRALGVQLAELGGVPIDELTALMSAVFDRAALAIVNGEPEKRYKAAVRFLLKGLADAT